MKVLIVLTAVMMAVALGDDTSAPDAAPAETYSAPAPAPAPTPLSYPVPVAYRNVEYAPSPYSFLYEVRDEPSNNDYAHQETSDGKVVTGSYRVLLPDGRIQVVTYTADNNGYVANVKYEGAAKFPEYSSSTRSYSAPAPVEKETAREHQAPDPAPATEN